MKAVQGNLEVVIVVKEMISCDFDDDYYDMVICVVDAGGGGSGGGVRGEMFVFYCVSYGYISKCFR